VPRADVADAVWYGEAPVARLTRVLLSPLSGLFAAIVARRNARYDAVAAAPSPIPAISIGNLTVGGTGKTPVSAWFASELRARGATPAIVMRGYGDDEVLVHALLNPDIRVFAGADRVAQVRAAAAAGADIAILDDAFQHRRAARVADVVLVSADRWRDDVRLLPAGPFREPLASLGRAALVLVTVKAADSARVAACVRAVRAATTVPVVTVDLVPGGLRAVHPERAGAANPADGPGRVLAVSAIGDPAAFLRQLVQGGRDATSLPFADHHAFDARDVQRIIAAAASCTAVICTLKDAVKLGPIWPDDAVPLWYLPQSVVPRDGVAALDGLVRQVLEARRNGPSLSDLTR